VEFSARLLRGTVGKLKEKYNWHSKLTFESNTTLMVVTDNIHLRLKRHKITFWGIAVNGRIHSR